MKSLLFAFVIIFCLFACSDKFELGYRVVQMENDSYVIQKSRYKDALGWNEWTCLYYCAETNTIVEQDETRWYSVNQITVYCFATREKACIECNELIQAKIDRESPYKVRRAIKCQ